MRKLEYLRLIALICLLVNTPAFASVLYSDVNLFKSALGSLVIDDYQNANYGPMLDDNAMSEVLGETRYQSITWDNQNMVTSDGLYCSGCNGTFLLDFTSTSVTEGAGVYGVGFEFFNVGDPLLNAFVSYGDGTSEWFSLLDSSSEQNNMRFWGATSLLKISSIYFGLQGDLAVEDSAFGIDNLIIGSSKNFKPTIFAPEPSSLLLMLLGLVALSRSRSLSKSA